VSCVRGGHAIEHVVQQRARYGASSTVSPISQTCSPCASGHFSTRDSEWCTECSSCPSGLVTPCTPVADARCEGDDYGTSSTMTPFDTNNWHTGGSNLVPVYVSVLGLLLVALAGYVVAKRCCSRGARLNKRAAPLSQHKVRSFDLELFKVRAVPRRSKFVVLAFELPRPLATPRRRHRRRVRGRQRPLRHRLRDRPHPRAPTHRFAIVSETIMYHAQYARSAIGCRAQTRRTSSTLDTRLGGEGGRSSSTPSKTTSTSAT